MITWESAVINFSYIKKDDIEIAQKIAIEKNLELQTIDNQLDCFLIHNKSAVLFLPRLGTPAVSKSQTGIKIRGAR